MVDTPPSSRWERVLPPLVASLTLGLAPFVPEPHLWEKLRWVATGAEGMAPIDWFDLLMHGAPWVWLGATSWAVWRDRHEEIQGPPKGDRSEEPGSARRPQGR